MEKFKEIQNRQLQSMLKPARERLKKYSAEELCRKCRIDYDRTENEFYFKSMNHDIKVYYPDYVIDEELEMWHHLTLLQYMDTADGTELSGSYIGLQEMRGGLSRGRGFDKDIENMFADYFKNTNADEFKAACIKAGGKIFSEKADVTAIFTYTPMFPVKINFWEADEEFPASGKVMVDANAEHYLTIEAAGGACAAVVQEIRKSLSR